VTHTSPGITKAKMMYDHCWVFVSQASNCNGCP